MLRQGWLRSAAIAILVVLPATLPSLVRAANDSINCPRSSAYWAKQCNDERWHGQLHQSAVSLIAKEAGRRSSFFMWPVGTELDCFASVLFPSPPANPEELAHREFAAFLATVSAGELGIRTAADEPVGLVGETEISCDGLGAENLNQLIEEIDSLLIALDPLPDGDEGTEAVYQTITAALQDLNGGIGIETTCDLECVTVPVDVGAGRMVIGIGDHDPDVADGGGGSGDPG